jgi:hypothetical protein
VLTQLTFVSEIEGQTGVLVVGCAVAEVEVDVYVFAVMGTLYLSSACN